jgi:hypothetical protein
LQLLAIFDTTCSPESTKVAALQQKRLSADDSWPGLGAK